VANLLLARATVRARELAVRSALGAGRGRIIRQLLTESLTLAALGGVLGVVLGAWLLRLAPALIPPGVLPAAVALGLDGRVLAFCAAAAIAVGVIFGVMPAWQATRTSLVDALASDSRTTTRSGGRVRSWLAAGQVASAVLLLCGAGLLMRTLWVVASFEPGYDVDGDTVVTLDFTIPRAGYPTAARLHQFYDEVEREVRALPNVRSVGWSTSLPWGNAELGRWPFEIAGDAPIEAASRPVAEYAVANPGYFHTLGIPIVAGRGLTERDTSDASPVCLVNEAFARRYLGGRNPIGARVSIKPPFLATAAVREIVGVARQVKDRPDAPQELVQVYVPLAQAPFDDIYLVVQPHQGRPEALVPAIRAAVARLDVNVPVRRIRTLDDLGDEATVRYRFRAVTVATFSGLALVLAMVGVFGVLAYAVEQRRREFAVRVALGASTARLLRLVLGSAIRIIAGGALVGLVLSAAVSRSITSFLFGVTPLDPVTLVVVTAVLVLTGAVSTLAPALRAARVDPAAAFRSDR
jgi:putative ABC transport system permease protein